jgi:predicted glycosyltransferase
MEQRGAAGQALRRILVYTHNSIGLGHAVRTMALIDGMRRAAPGIEWLVLSGTSAPRIFLDQGVEIVKLPGVRHALDVPGHPFLPRSLGSFGIHEIIAWRRRIIEECRIHFKPDVIMIEHSLAGLMGEAAPLLAARAARGAEGGGPVLIHLSRGIYGAAPRSVAASIDWPGLPPHIAIPHLYDALYVFDERTMVDVNREFFGNDPALEARIRYLGRISARNADELGDSPGFPGTRRAGNRPFVLVVLGRFGRVEDLHVRILDACRNVGFGKGKEILVVPDVYLKPEVLKNLTAHPAARGVRFAPFIPHLVDVMARADLVVCRAGYNVVNEVMLTGVKALIIPESHPSGEQERRAASLSGHGLLVRTESACQSGDLESELEELMRQPARPSSGDFDRFRIGRIMVEDLEQLLAGRGRDFSEGENSMAGLFSREFP